MQALESSVTTTTLSDAVGAEIGGIDLRQELDAAAVELLRAAWLEHHLLLIRDQELDDIEHRRFCEYLGEIQVERTAKDVESREITGMLFVSNVRPDAILPSGDMWFHSDQCYFDTPCKATSLYAIEVPGSGGNTRFANCRRAYDALSNEMKEKLDGLKAMNVYAYPSPNECRKLTTREDFAHRFSHPVVRTHPETRRKSLYVNRLMTDYIVDMDESESDVLLESLFDHMEQEQFIYEHVWRPRDLVIWENRCLVHGRSGFDPGERRLLRRFALQGEKPS